MFMGCIALGALFVFQAVGWAASALPGPIDVPFYCYTIQAMPNGQLFTTGARDLQHSQGQSFLWSPDSGKWEPIGGEAKLTGRVEVLPLNEKCLVVHRNSFPGFLSEDGGRSWRQLFPAYIQFGETRRQICLAFGSLHSPAKLFLQQIAGDDEDGRIFELDTPSGNLKEWSKTGQYFSKYRRADGKHYGWMGPLSQTPPSCVCSTDDGKTWIEVPPENTPWALDASAQAQIPRLLPIAERQKNMSQMEKDNDQPGVMWAIDVAGTAFCRIENLKGSYPSSNPSLFVSKDQGENWMPAPLDRRTSDPKTLFSDLPLIIRDASGAASIGPLAVELDKKNGMVFAGAKGQWFATPVAGGAWQSVNTLPQPTANK